MLRTMHRLARPLLVSSALMLAASPALAQQPDTLIRLNALEQQVRELNGRIEELNFFILQMQEELRRQKEDNEFRFRDLEGGATGASDVGTEQRGDIEPATPDTDTATIENDESVFDAGNEVATAGDTGGNIAPDEAPADEPTLGEPPRDLGTLTLPGIDPNATGSLDLPAEFSGDDTLIAALEDAGDASALYDRGYEFALAGDYARAEQIFRLHLKRYDGDATAPQATYWLGESLLAQGRSEEAAEVLLDGHSSYGDSEWAPDMLLKVGVAMAQLGNRDIACATYDEVQRLYPRMPQRTANLVNEQREEATC